MLILAAQVGPYNDYAGLFLGLLVIVAAAACRLFARESRRHHARLLQIVSLSTRHL